MSRGGDRFSRRGGGGSKQDEVGRTIYQRVEALMENRWKYLNQFDLVKDFKTELYRYAMTEAEWNAWELLEANKSFRNAMTYTSQLHIVNNEGGFNITITRPSTERYVSMPIRWYNLPEALREGIHNWMIRSETYKQEYVEVRGRVKSLSLICSTPGQIERVWPELMGFMPGHVIDSRLEKKSKSPYPDGVWEDGWELLHPDERKLKEKYRRENLDWFNDALAEALILPLQNWKEQPTFPEVTFLK